jgi:hypothetical protein
MTWDIMLVPVHVFGLCNLRPALAPLTRSSCTAASQTADVSTAALLVALVSSFRHRALQHGSAPALLSACIFDDLQ